MLIKFVIPLLYFFFALLAFNTYTTMNYLLNQKNATQFSVLEKKFKKSITFKIIRHSTNY